MKPEMESASPQSFDHESNPRSPRPTLHISPPAKLRKSPSPPLDKDGRRRSIFTEIGLGGAEDAIESKLNKSQSRPRLQVRFRSKVEVHSPCDGDGEFHQEPVMAPAAAVPPVSRFALMTRLLFFAFILAFLIPALQNSGLMRANLIPMVAKAGPIPATPMEKISSGQLAKRTDSETMVCKRWSQQTALVNGTLYIYGGRKLDDGSQTSDEWNNDLLTLDLTKDWEVSSPSLTGLPVPSGPPPVANGFLWNSYSTLFLYGGEYSDTPITSPSPFALWSYDVSASTWASTPSPTTTAGENSDGGGQYVQDSAEGAGINVPELGRGFYFGGHQDGYTTAGWSQSIARVYLKSMIEFTFPGSTNPSITSGDKTAGSDGIWRNITEGGLQDSAGFTERADGILVYVPGYSDDGIIIGLAGGTAAQFTQMNIIDVFDIASSTWYKQYTSGTTPEYRVNPCAVAVSAPDGSSTNVYMYGGQNLQPYEQQIQYSDMWILTIPSFTWIKVDITGQSVPPARAGHTCNVWNSQMVVVGGYVGQELQCDTPGYYVFDTVALTWNSSYVALDASEASNPLNQQLAQKKDPSGLGGSYGYYVPDSVQKVIGGNSAGGATVTTPAASATGGPFATGSPKTYTVTAGGGGSAVTTKVTTTNSAGTVVTSSAVTTTGSTPIINKSSGGPNIAAIVAGVVAGLFFLLAAYLGFCAWVYRRHLTLYKNHVAMVQRTQLGMDTQQKNGLLFPPSTLDTDSPSAGKGRTSDEGSSGRHSGRKAGYQPVPGGGGGAGRPAWGKNESGRSGSTKGRSGSTKGKTGAWLTAGGHASGGERTSSGRTAGDTGSDRMSISSTEDLMGGAEPSFLGVMLNPRRTLRVINN